VAEKQIQVRAARAADLDALTALRLENGRAHVELDPTVYRVPERSAVERYFADRVGASALWVATADGNSVVGMVEIVPNPPPPDDEILRPVPAAHVHVVVSRDARGRGVGTALLQRAEEWASTHGIERLVAGIQSDNSSGLGFYEHAGYRENGRVKIKDVPQATD
jgi:ribosomal protein S18 acetylase RimI-like enzyme